MENQSMTILDDQRVGMLAVTFTSKQIELIKRTVAKGTTDDELALFLYTAKRVGLDPLAKQIHCVRRGGQSGSISIQTAIDGYRLIADRTNKYAGNDDPVFDDESNPTKAMVTVYKIVDGVRCPFTATARWSQYYPGDSQGFMWKKMPHLMLGKCAEALALRKAFPAELSGLYTDDEMHQSDAVEVRPPIQQPKPKASTPSDGGDYISEAQGKRFYAIWKASGKKEADVRAKLKEVTGKENSREIKRSQYEELCAWARGGGEQEAGDAQEQAE